MSIKRSDFGFRLIVCLKISFPIEPPQPVMHIFKSSVEFFSNSLFGLTAVLPNKSSISIGLNSFIFKFRLVRSWIDGTLNTGISYSLILLNIIFESFLFNDGIANSIWSILSLNLFIFFETIFMPSNFFQISWENHQRK